MTEQKIHMTHGKLQVPNNPTIPFIEGDGIGVDIWASAQPVFDSAVERAYNGEKKITWKEVYAGEKAFKKFDSWLPEETLQAFRDYQVGIKGPLTTPIGGGIRSLNVALRQELDLYVCQRPVCWFKGVPSPVKHPEKVDMVIFRENSEDIYAGIEFKAGSEEVEKLKSFLVDSMGVTKIRFPDTCGLGIKPVSQEGTERLVKSAIEYAIREKRKSVTLVHKGNIMKFTEGAFRDWGYGLATREFRNEVVTERESWILANKDNDPLLTVEANAKILEPGYHLMNPGQQTTLREEVQAVLDSIYNSHGNLKYKDKIVIKDAIADIALQQVLTRPKEFDVIATLNLNGDYLSDALAAQVGGIGIAPGGNINYNTGHAIFEATHGTAPKYTSLDKVNPGSVILSGEMMLRYMGWTKAADLIIRGMNTAIANKTVTYDFHRMMEDATLLKCSEFGQAVIKGMA